MPAITQKRRTERLYWSLWSHAPRHARVLAEIVYQRDRHHAGRCESLVHRTGLIETVLDHERATGLEMRARLRADAIVERKAIGAAVECQARFTQHLGLQRRDHGARDVRRALLHPVRKAPRH